MKNCMPSIQAKVILITLLFLFTGCKNDKVPGYWRTHDIVPDGIDNEWQGNPQYYNEDKNIAIRMVNDTEDLFLCLSTSNDELKRQLSMTGLTIWLDPSGGQDKIFGVHLPGLAPRRHGYGKKSEQGEGTPPGEEYHTEGGEKQPTPPQMPVDLEITYKNTTGPLSMTMDEVRRTGIEIGVDRPRGDRLVYEFKLGYKAAPCLADIKPGMVVGVGIQTGEGKRDGRKKDATDGEMETDHPGGGDWGGRPGSGGGMGRMGPKGSGGGMRGKSGSQGPGDKYEPLEIWLELRLAEQA